MNTFTSKSFIERLDSFFDRDDMPGAGKYLELSRDIAEINKDDELLFTVLNEMMGYYRKVRDEEKGLESVASSIALTEKLGLSEKINGATAYLNAATTMKAFGRSSDALPLYEAAERVYLSVLPSHDPRMAGLYNNLALALCDLERHSEAEEKYLSALSVLSKNYRKETDIANTYVNMAHLYEKTDSYELIEDCIRKAKAALDSCPLRDAYYAYTCKKCAPSFIYFGFFADGKELDERGERIYENNRSSKGSV